MRYNTLVRVLDQIRNEAPPQHASRYKPDAAETEKVNQARSRAFIHLYLKVMFGLTDFQSRERTITDSSGDGGVDGYFIDADSKTIYLIQSKFRTTARNFEQKEITLEELLAMDISRILDGETTDENGNEYNGKIKQLQREVSSLPDVARFSYRVVILANLTGVSSSKLKTLTGGYATEVFDFERTYQKLVFPVITGNYYAAGDIVIPIDLSNKSSGSKISYNVKTKYSDCEITVLFVPTIEIAKVMQKYKNAILKYNPRSYLDFEGKSVNAAIRDTILATQTNEFALFNNGITMLSEETNINERIGQKNKAQLRVKNPQIINGGQTSFTLSRILSENIHCAESIFEDKEVLLKIITLLDNDSHAAKIDLIDEISTATNKQTPVINADRFANESFHLDVQRKLFDRFGLLYERKRGEYSDGILDGYIDPQSLIERNQFWRFYYTANGQLSKGSERRLFQKNQFKGLDLSAVTVFDRAVTAMNVYRLLRKSERPYAPAGKDIFAKIYMYLEMFGAATPTTSANELENNVLALETKWASFVNRQLRVHGPKKRAYIDKTTGEARIKTAEPTFQHSPTIKADIEEFLRNSPEEAA